MAAVFRARREAGPDLPGGGGASHRFAPDDGAQGDLPPLQPVIAEPDPSTCADRSIDPEAEVRWVQDLLGPAYDEAAFRAMCAEWQALLPLERDFAFQQWVQDRATRLLATEQSLWSPCEPQWLGQGSYHAAFRVEGVGDRIAKVDVWQAGRQASFNAQFLGRRPDHPVPGLDDMLDGLLREERELQEAMRHHFGEMLVPEDIYLDTISIPGRTLLAAMSRGDPRDFRSDEREPGVWFYRRMRIEVEATYCFRTFIRLQEDHSETYRRIVAGEDAYWLQVQPPVPDEVNGFVPACADRNNPISLEEHARACQLWIAGDSRTKPFDAQARALFEKVVGRNQYSTVCELMKRCEGDQAFRDALLEFALKAAAFANERHAAPDVLGRNNIAFLKDDDGGWACRMLDSMPPGPQPLLARYGEAVRGSAGEAGTNGGHHWPVFTVGPFALAINGLLHYFERSERVVIPGLPRTPDWDAMFHLNARLYLPPPSGKPFIPLHASALYKR